MRTLDSLQAQEGSFEIIVVDNAADENVRDALGRFTGARNPVRWIPEPRLGLLYTRSSGAMHARSALLAYVDDDVTIRRALQTAYGVRREARRASGLAIDHHATRSIRAHDVDLLFFPSVSRLAASTPFPSIIAVHDIQHRLQPHLPEYAPPGLWDELENILRRAASGSALLVAESETGREDLLEAYSEHGLTSDRVMVVPYAVPGYLRKRPLEHETARVRETFSLPERFLFYPANFLPHKNHAVLIEAMGVMRMRYQLRPSLVLVGDRGAGLRARTFANVMETARRVGVVDQIRYLGFVDDDDLGGIFSAADVMVMPSSFGPTNLPILEAWEAECPVVTSDLRGIREMCGDAALLVDPGSVDDLCETLRALWTDADARAALVGRANIRLQEFSPSRLRDALFRVFEEGKRRATD
ncbi:MAG: glycosyltransferase [bacterium]